MKKLGNNEYILSLDSNAFNALKSDFNQVLRRTLANMIQKEGEKAELKIALTITLEQGMAPDNEIHSYTADREIIVPKFEHKVSSVMTYKDEAKGKLGGVGYELIWDKDVCDYILRSIKDGQQSFFDNDYKNDSRIDDGGDDDNEDDNTGESEQEEYTQIKFTEVYPVKTQPDISCEARDNGTCETINSCGCCCADCGMKESCKDICDIVKNCDDNNADDESDEDAEDEGKDLSDDDEDVEPEDDE